MTYYEAPRDTQLPALSGPQPDEIRFDPALLSPIDRAPRVPRFGDRPSLRFVLCTVLVVVAAFLFGLLWPYVLVHT